MSPSRSKKSRSRAAVAVDACPRCGAPLAEPGTTMLCSQCRAIVLPAHRQAVRIGLIAIVAGGVAALLTAVLLLFSSGAIHGNASLAAAVVSVLSLAGFGAVFGAWWAGRIFQQVTARDTPEARALLELVDKISFVALTTLGLVVALLGLWLFLPSRDIRPEIEKAFAGELEKFNHLVEDNNEEVKESTAKLQGKLLVLDQGVRMPGVTPGKISEVQFDLPSRLRASKPDEVGTVVWLRWNREVKGRYRRSGSAYLVRCEAFVIDPSQPAVVARQEFSGGPPPGSAPAGQDGYGTRPTAEIIDYLKGLIGN